MSEHFKLSEFTCKCGCGQTDIDERLIDKLEKLRSYLGDNPILVSSGCRCRQHDINVGGTGTGMHTLGGAADIACIKPDTTLYTANTIAEYAEKCGFTGIGIINDNYVHVDIRGIIPYSNSHWYGDERTNSNIKTFAGSGEPVVHRFTDSVKEIKVVLEYENKKYSGLLSEI